MMKRRTLLLGLAGVSIGGLSYTKLGSQKLAEIQFDLGKNIVETAKASGVPRFQVSNTAGYIG